VLLADPLTRGASGFIMRPQALLRTV